MSDDDEQRRRRAERGRKHQERGREFHRGMAEIRGETTKNGWRHERTVELGPNRARRHDMARINERGGRDFTEYKGGNKVGGDFTMRQLAKDREILERDRHARGTWVLIQGAASREVRQELEAMVRDFGDRFQVERVTRAQARLARQRGRALERERNQLELFNSVELRMEQRQRERQARERDRARTQEAVQRALEKQAREWEAQEIRQRRREAHQREREAVQRVAEFSRQAREAAARGEKVGMTSRAIADIRALSFPNQLDPAKSQHREHPEAGSTRASRVQDPRSRERGLERGR